MKKLVFPLLFALLPLLLRAAAPGSGWEITARDSAGYAPATMANGELGIVVGRDPFAMGNLYVGSSFRRGDAGRVSSILNGINPIGLVMTVDGRRAAAESWSQSIDMLRAVHTTRFSTPELDVVYSVRALRNMPWAVMMQVELEARRDVSAVFTNSHSIPGFMADTARDSRKQAGCLIQRSWASYNRGADHIAAASVFICGEPFDHTSAESVSVTLRRGERASFALVGTVCTTGSFADPWNESERQAIYAVREGAGKLAAAHESLWRDLWRGDIEISGDPEAQRAVRFAIFNIYSSIREGSRRSIAPMGLTSLSYNGHIFWDAEMWIYPALLVLRPELAREMVDYRTDRTAPARLRAAAHGYRGAMFPWEADDLGEESTPNFALTGPLEHHITADVAIGAWNYFRVTRDLDWLRREGYPLIRACAEFWCSRVCRNDDGTYSIRNVVGADEYAIGVDDNAFTNGSARCALEYAAAAAEACGQAPDPRWRETARGIRIERFPDGTTREHASYDGETIKQADANLLGYPLGVVADREGQLRDMAYYKERINKTRGPAMSHSVFAVQYARAGMRAEAEEMFERSYKPNLRPPFGVFAETATSNNPYFVTGAGGMLQAVLFGFAGLEITDEGLVQGRGLLPKGWKSLTVKTSGGDTYSVR